MLEHFRRERPVLEQIVAMTAQEHGVERIASNFVRLDDDFTPSATARRSRLSDERWAEYRRLFRLANLPDGVGFGSGRVYFYDYASGLAGSGEEKGFVWSTNPVSPLANNLDHPAQLPLPDVFRHIDGPWYLEYTADE